MSIFAKVNVELVNHHRLLKVPRRQRAAALGVWLAALLYTREHELDGFCPLEALEYLATRANIDHLVRVELVAREEKDGVRGIRVLRYSDHNDTKAQIDSRREETRRRVAKYRSNTVSNAVTNANVPGSGSGSVSDLKNQSEDPRSETRLRVTPRNPNADGCFGMAVSAWVDSIGQATRRPFTPPSPGETAKLVACFDAHFPDIAKREAGVRDAAAEYASTATADQISVWGFSRWLDSGRRHAAESGPRLRNAPYIQPAGGKWKVGQ